MIEAIILTLLLLILWKIYILLKENLNHEEIRSIVHLRVNEESMPEEDTLHFLQKPFTTVRHLYAKIYYNL